MEALAASWVTSGRFGMARMPDGTSGQVLTAQGAGADPAYAAAPPGALQTLCWGGTWDNLDYFLKSNGITTEADAASTYATRFPVAKAGTLDTVSFYHAADLSTDTATIAICVNGVSKTTFVASADTGVEVFTSLGVSVSAGDYVEVKLDARFQDPLESLVVATIE